MTTLKQVQVHLKSVKNIQKITQSMKMVSAAKYARAERELRNTRPYGLGAEQFYKVAPIKPIPTIEPKKIFIAITSDRGLCGAVHSSIGRQIRNWLLTDKTKPKIFCVGDKSRAILQRLFSKQFLMVAKEIGRLPPTFTDASQIAIQIGKTGYDYTHGKIVYNRFKSVVSYQLNATPIYSRKTIEATENISVYDSLDSDVIQSHLEFLLASLIYFALKEGACSEQSSRMTAMDNASKNAGKMIDELTLRYNRTRQSVITRELVEIISGASALQSKE